MLEPIQKKIQEYHQDPAELMKILDRGRDIAKDMAEKKLKIVKQRIGIGR